MPPCIPSAAVPARARSRASERRQIEARDDRNDPKLYGPTTRVARYLPRRHHSGGWQPHAAYARPRVGPVATAGRSEGNGLGNCRSRPQSQDQAGHQALRPGASSAAGKSGRRQDHAASRRRPHNLPDQIAGQHGETGPTNSSARRQRSGHIGSPDPCRGSGCRAGLRPQGRMRWVPTRPAPTPRPSSPCRTGPFGSAMNTGHHSCTSVRKATCCSVGFPRALRGR